MAKGTCTLLAAIVYGVEKNIFPLYELYPTVRLWFNKWRVIRHSREAKLDLKVLREQDLIKEVEINNTQIWLCHGLFVRGGKVKIELERDAPTLR